MDMYDDCVGILETGAHRIEHYFLLQSDFFTSGKLANLI